MNPLNPNNASAAHVAQENNSTPNIDSLLEKLCEYEALLAASEARSDAKDALLAEKDSHLQAYKKMQLCKHCTPSLSIVNEEDSDVAEGGEEGRGRPATATATAADEIPPAPVSSIGSFSTYADYLEHGRQLKIKLNNSIFSSMSATATVASKATVRTAEEIRVIQRLAREGGPEWNHLSFGPLEADGTRDGSIIVPEENHDNGSRTPWYNPPIQRQRWDEEQRLPHVNWGDLFFDLFYVGAAFNLGVLIMTTGRDKKDELLRGFIYFFGSLGPLWTCWEVQTFYQSRYVTNDYFHRILDIVRYFCVGFAIYNITPLHLYSDPLSSNMMEFTLAMFVELMIAMGLCLELYYKGLGDRVSIQNHTLDDFKFRNAALFVFYLAAFIIAAVNFAQARKEVPDANDIVEAETVDSQAVEDLHHEATIEHGMGESGGHRLLNSSSSHEEVYVVVDRAKWDIYDLPMTLTTVAYFLRFFMTSMRFFLRDMKGDIRRWYIPTNIDYLIHRYGEFVMLMIGEGVLSLLIIETIETPSYYDVVEFGLLTMIFIHVLKSESEPQHSSKHAMWTNRARALWYSVFVQTLTIGLIGFGVSYKSFLHEIDEEVEERHEEHFPVIAKAFSAFLTIVILSLELMSGTHCGIKQAIGHLLHSSNSRKRLYWPVVIVSLLKVGVILFCATLFVWTIEPPGLAIAGLCVVFALSVTRVLNHIFINKKEMVETMSENAVNFAHSVSRRVLRLDEGANN